MALDLTQHPCFNSDVRHTTGRIHLPVAPKCNIQCNYCDRKFDCMNESRPGVTSAVLEPKQALAYLDKVLERVPQLKVVGIAGPGDPFAMPEETLETLRLVREKYPEMLLCVASNGLNVAPYAEELASLQVSHVTITVNAVDPAIGAKIYSWVRDHKTIYRGEAAARLLLERQLSAIKALKAAGVTLKINTILVPGINDDHVEAVADQDARAGRRHHELHSAATRWRARRLREIGEVAAAGGEGDSRQGCRSCCRRWSTARAAAPTPSACWAPISPPNLSP